MIIKEVVEKTNIESNFDLKDKEFNIDFSDQNTKKHLYETLYDYSDPISSIVRELTSNGYDAHIEADKINEPVIITLSKNSIQFSDNGCGMSPDRVQNIYTEFFKSTKRNTNKQIGGWGLGCKTPLSYTDSFKVKTIYDGIEYIYLVYKVDNIPNLMKLSSYETDKENGTTISLEYNEGEHVDDFANAIFDQLLYFPNVVVDCEEINSIRIKSLVDNFNNRKIYKGDHFYISNFRKRSAHLVIGPVCYPILTQNTIKKNMLGLGLRFNIGDLKPTRKREQVVYNDDVIFAIKQKYELAKKEFYNKIKDYKETHTFENWLKGDVQFQKEPIINNVKYKVDLPFPRYGEKGEIIRNIFSKISDSSFITIEDINIIRYNLFNNVYYLTSNGNRDKDNHIGFHKIFNEPNITHFKINRWNKRTGQYIKQSDDYNNDVRLYYLSDYTELNDFREHVIDYDDSKKIIELFKIYRKITKVLKEKLISFDDVDVPDSFAYENSISNKEITYWSIRKKYGYDSTSLAKSKTYLHGDKAYVLPLGNKKEIYNLSKLFDFMKGLFGIKVSIYGVSKSNYKTICNNLDTFNKEKNVYTDKQLLIDYNDELEWVNHHLKYYKFKKTKEYAILKKIKEDDKLLKISRFSSNTTNRNKLEEIRRFVWMINRKTQFNLSDIDDDFINWETIKDIEYPNYKAIKKLIDNNREVLNSITYNFPKEKLRKITTIHINANLI